MTDIVEWLLLAGTGEGLHHKAAAEITQLRAELARWKEQSDDWQKRGWELGNECDRIEAELAAERELADRFGDVGRLIIDGFGFTSDGNDGYREVETVLIETLDKLVSDYNATRRNK